VGIRNSVGDLTIANILRARVDRYSNSKQLVVLSFPDIVVNNRNFFHLPSHTSHTLSAMQNF
jgi:hypothetical protein